MKMTEKEKNRLFRKRLEELTPLYLELNKQIKRLKRLGFDVIGIRIPDMTLDQCFTASTLHEDYGRECLFKYNHDLKTVNNRGQSIPNYLWVCAWFDGIKIMHGNPKRIEFTIAQYRGKDVTERSQ